ncbi:T9SS type A sorting domain-containing protein [bacterium]|nr:T9SS type A sorting domain-containing protein [bacterium]
MKQFVALMFACAILAAAPLRTFAESTFETHTVTENMDNACAVKFADMDGDGDMDLVSTGWSASRVAWFEQTENGDWPSHPISWSFYARDIDIADLDGDGDMDVVGASFNQNAFRWFEQQEDGSFTNHLISDEMTQAHTPAVADLDGDGDLDIALSTFAAGYLWWENDGDQNFTSHTLLEGAVSGTMMDVLDWDDDGDKDLIGVSEDGDAVYLWTNDGSGSFGFMSLVEGYNAAHWVAVADLDGDGDKDIATVAWSGSNLSWWENEGSNVMTQHSLGYFFGAATVHVADFDWDGDVDLVATADGGDEVSWWENDGGETPEFTRQILSENFNHAFGLGIGDIDNDGDFDIAATSSSEATILLYENLLPQAGVKQETGSMLPGGFVLSPVSPNPFNAQATVTVELPARGDLTLTLFDILGREVAELTDGIHSPGTHHFSLNANDLSTGVYFLHASFEGGEAKVQRVVLVK